MRSRLDRLLVERGLAESREKAQALIMAGSVTVDGQKAAKPGQPVDPASAIELLARPPYVSRGVLKLAAALDHFAILVEGSIDAAQRRLQRNPGHAPGFDQRPVQRREQKKRPAPLLEALFDLGEVVEVVQHGLLVHHQTHNY